MTKLRKNRLRQVLSLIEDAKTILEEVKDEEETAMDNMPENLQGTARYEQMEDAVCNLEDAVCNLEDAVDSIQEVL